MPAPKRRRGTGRVVFVVPLMTCVLGLLAAGAIWSRETEQAKLRDSQAANQIATALAQVAGTGIDGLRGASAMVADDGVVSDAELRVFADDVASGSMLRAVAHELLVTNADRPAFEARVGYAISDVGPDGTLVPAPRRDEYAPVVAVVARDASVVPNYGFDILGDPERSSAVRAADGAGEPTISPPIQLVPNGRTGYLGVAPLRRPDGTVVGYVSASFAVDDVVAAAVAGVDVRADVAVFDRGQRVAGDLDRGARAALVIGGRTLELRADERTGPTRWPALVVVAGSVIASVALALAIQGLRRSERAAGLFAEHLDDERARAMRLADLGRELTAVRSRGELASVLDDVLPGTVGADGASLGFVDGVLLRPVSGAGLVPLDTHLPSTEAVRGRRVVLVEDIDEYQRGHSDLLADARARHVGSAASVPLMATDTTAIGVVGLVWNERRTFTSADEVALTTLGSLVAGTVQRVDAAADAVRHAVGLARLAEELALATTIDEAVSAAADHLPSIADAADVHLTESAQGGSDGTGHVLTDTSGDPLGELVVTWPGGGGPDVGQQQRLQAALGLIDQTVRRVDIQRATSEALLSLRQRLLRPLPTLPGLDLAARYRPTSRPLGMGGDWYDVVERPGDEIGIVVGDVVGHGIPAIATMIHVSTILGGLVRSSTPVDELVARAGDMLDADGMVATALVLLIDPAACALTMVSAGHPPPLLRRPDGSVERLPEATHAPLGVGDGSGRAVRMPFPPGAGVLAYTDGLVERRGEPIDVGISRLADVFAATEGSVWGTVSDVLGAMTPGGDDVALVVAEHRRGPGNRS